MLQLTTPHYLPSPGIQLRNPGSPTPLLLLVQNPGVLVPSPLLYPLIPTPSHNWGITQTFWLPTFTSLPHQNPHPPRTGIEPRSLVSQPLPLCCNLFQVPPTLGFSHTHAVPRAPSLTHSPSLRSCFRSAAWFRECCLPGKRTSRLSKWECVWGPCQGRLCPALASPGDEAPPLKQCLGTPERASI